MPPSRKKNLCSSVSLLLRAKLFAFKLTCRNAEMLCVATEGTSYIAAAIGKLSLAAAATAAELKLR